VPLEPVSPPGLAPPAANYSHAVVATGVTRWLHTSGVVATRPDGSVPDGVGEQVAVVWENLTAILAEAAMTTADVVSIVTYVVVGHDLAVVMAARDRAMAGQRPASTLVPVPALARPAWLVEIALVAAR
jgi:2-iminobutanoate/2-iminopropanoate deaminase